MKSARVHEDALLGRIKRNGCVVMLDFDGTLAPIVSHHRRAALSTKTHKLLEGLAKRVPVAVISGRSLSDVRSRVRIHGISYAGSHGLEVLMSRPHISIHVDVPKRTLQIFHEARGTLGKIAARYPRVRIEDKGMSYAIHYRSLTPKQSVAFLHDADIALAAHIKSGAIRAINDLSTFDIMPHSKRTKGHCAREMYRALRKSEDAVPIYIGDGVTDEDAFRAFKTGITIKVGKAPSAAKYFFSSRADVDRFLRLVARIPHA